MRTAAHLKAPSRQPMAPGGTLAVAGYFQNSVDFGSGALTSAGSFDGFVGTVAP